jgi:hypothetical protein
MLKIKQVIKQMKDFILQPKTGQEDKEIRGEILF